MPFLHPFLLWFLPLAAIPIVLHLLTLHRLRTVELSTFRFLFDSYVQQRRQMKFLEALLAFLRTLFLLLLVMVCCRPVVSHWKALFGGGAGRDVVMMVDCSASMNAQTAGLSSLDRAKAAALKVVERLSPDDRLTLVRVTNQPQEVFSRFSSDTEAIRDHVEALATSPSRGNWFAALAHVFAPGKPQREQSTVYAFTDCQASGFNELAKQTGQRLVPEKARLIVVNVGSQEPLANRGVVGTPPRQHRAIVGLPIVLRPRVANYSKTETVEVALGVFVDEKEVARRTLTIKPGDAAEKEIIYVPTEPGTFHGRFQIADDRFPDDDQYLFTLTVEPPIKVLLVNGNASNDPFENEGLYLRTALTARGEEDEGPPKPAAPQVTSAGAAPQPAPLAPSKEYIRSLDVQEIAENVLNADTLRDASVVILANCGALNQQHFGWLRDFVAAGGGLVIFPGDRVNPDAYNQQFFIVPGPQSESLISARLSQAVGDVQKFDTFVQFTSLDYAHPILSVFDDPESRYLTTAHFYRRFPLKLDERRGDCWPLARFSPQEPAIVESRFHDGVVLLAAFPATARWSNLPLKPEFVPLVLRMVNHAERRADFEAPSVVPADGTARIAVAATWTPVVGRVTDAERHTADIEFQRDGTRWVGGFEHTATKGFYSVDVRGGRVEQPKQGVTSFAVNLAAEESQSAIADEEQLRDWMPNVDLTVVDASAEAQQELGALGDTHEVWRWLLYGMFVVIGVEFTLATLGGKRPDVLDDEAPIGERIRQFNPGTWVGRMTGAEELSGPK